MLDECFVIEACIDRYLWALYQRTAKEDSIKVQERRAVTVKRKGKTVTVMRSFTKLVDQDFGWKDPKAAERAGMSMMDYVIGGMDKSFKKKLFRTLLAAEAAGLSPGITSAFRDDYRQSIASGLKAASDRSIMGAARAAVMATAWRPTSSAPRATTARSAGSRPRSCGSGSTPTARRSASAAPISAAIRRMSARSTGRNTSHAAALRPTTRKPRTSSRKKTRAAASAKPPKAHAAREQKSPAKQQKSAQSAIKPAT